MRTWRLLCQDIGLIWWWGGEVGEDQTKTESQLKVKIFKIIKNERMVSLGGNKLQGQKKKILSTHFFIGKATCTICNR